MKREYDFRRGRRGAVLPVPRKTRITIRLDDDVLEWFRARVRAAAGGSYQASINLALREHLTRGSLEDTLRRVLREELARAGGELARRPYPEEPLPSSMVAEGEDATDRSPAAGKVAARGARRVRRRKD